MNEEEYRGELLKDITHDNEPIENWYKEEIGSFLFFWKHIYDDPKETPGFQVMVIDWNSSDSDGDKYSTVMQVTAYFDGVRHIHFGDSKDSCGLGYFCYPDVQSLILVLQRIRQMEKEFLRSEHITKDLK